MGESDIQHILGLHRRFDQLRDGLKRALAGEPLPNIDFAERSLDDDVSGVSTWMPDVDNPSTFAMEPHHFEELLADATRRARDEIGPDARVSLWYVLIRLDVHGAKLHMPIVRFVGRSFNSQKDTNIEYSGSIERVVVHTFPQRVFPMAPVRKPWVAEPSYIKLIHDSWRRVNRDFHGVGMLIASDELYRGTTSVWVAAYTATSGALASLGNLFILDATGLRELDHL